MSGAALRLAPTGVRNLECAPLASARVWRLRIVGAVWVLLVAHAGAAADAPLTRLAFIPHWLPQAQFAGYYVAFDRGIYRQHGIDLSIVTGGPDRPASDALEHGIADCGTLWLSTAIQMRARGAPLVHVAQMSQRSALLLIAKKSSGIATPKDMDGKKVGVWDGDFLLQPQAFFRQHGLKVHIVPLASSINLFLRDAIDVTSAMWFNEYHAILNSGVDADELNLFLFQDYGLNFPEDGIYCTEQLCRDRPEVCRSFAQASLEGWQYAFAHPEETLDVVKPYMEQAHVATNRPHQQWMLARMQDLMKPVSKDTLPGTLVPEDYARVAKILKDNALITQVPEFSAFHPSLAVPP